MNKKILLLSSLLMVAGIFIGSVKVWSSVNTVVATSSLSAPSLSVVPADLEPTLTPIPRKASENIKMLFLGDIMLGRYVRTLMEKNGDLNYPFLKAKTTTGPGANFLNGYFNRVIANLEGPILPVPNRAQTGMSFGFAPDTAKIVKQNGIDIVSIANNHTLDQGERGFTSTEKYLKEGGLAFFGHPILPTEQDVLIETIHGKKFAFIGFHDAVHRLDDVAARALIAKIDSQVDYAIVVIHWGIEYKKTNSPRQQQLAHAFIDAGADLIIGHHPHVVQNREIYKGVPIVYSLGNFIFDQFWSAETQRGMAIEAVFSTDPQDRSIQLFEHPYDLPKSQPTWR